MEEGQIPVRSRRSRDCFGIVSHSDAQSFTHKASQPWFLKCELNKDDTNEHSKMDLGNSIRVQLYTKNFRQQRRDLIFPKEVHINWLSSTQMPIPVNIHTNNPYTAEHVIFMNKYVCAYCLHDVSTAVKRHHEHYNSDEQKFLVWVVYSSKV